MDDYVIVDIEQLTLHVPDSVKKVEKKLPEWTGCKCKIFCICAASGQICGDCMRPWGDNASCACG